MPVRHDRLMVIVREGGLKISGSSLFAVGGVKFHSCTYFSLFNSLALASWCLILAVAQVSIYDCHVIPSLSPHQSISGR